MAQSAQHRATECWYAGNLAPRTESATTGWDLIVEDEDELRPEGGTTEDGKSSGQGKDMTGDVVSSGVVTNLNQDLTLSISSSSSSSNLSVSVGGWNFAATFNAQRSTFNSQPIR